MSAPPESFDAAFTKAVDLGNKIADKNPDADVWDIADGLLAGALQYWLYSRQPCGDPACEDCLSTSTAEAAWPSSSAWSKSWLPTANIFTAPPIPTQDAHELCHFH